MLIFISFTKQRMVLLSRPQSLAVATSNSSILIPVSHVQFVLKVILYSNSYLIVCVSYFVGPIDDEEVREITQGLMIAWGDVTIKTKQEVHLANDAPSTLNTFQTPTQIHFPNNGEHVSIKQKNFEQFL